MSENNSTNEDLKGDSTTKASTTPSGGLFVEKLVDLTDYTDVVKMTERIIPRDNDFDPKKIPALAGKLNSIYQTGQLLRNKFSNGISPTDVMQLAQNGLTKELSKIASDNGLSSLFSNLGVKWDKTSYNYRESEKRIDGKNLSLNYNPLNVFQNLIVRMIKNRSDEDAKDVENFYLVLNTSRRRIFDANTELYNVLTSILEIHQLHDLRKYSVDIEKVFVGPEIYDDIYSIYQQLNQVTEVIHQYIIGNTTYIRFIKDKDRYLAHVESLGTIMSTFNSLIVIKELKYAYEDLKNLRKIDETTAFTPL